MNEYKVEVLTEILNGMKQDDYYLCRVKGDDTKTINLDEKAVELLIKYYNNKRR